MYTDTKNLINYSNNNTAMQNCLQQSETPTRQPKSSRKLLRPLLRLLLTKGGNKKWNNCNVAKAHHPNNMYLNNSSTREPQSQPDTEPELEECESHDALAQKGAIEPTEHAMQCAESTLLQQGSLISSASIEKPAASVHCGCAHGRNCLLVQYNGHISEEVHLHLLANQCILREQCFQSGQCMQSQSLQQLQYINKDLNAAAQHCMLCSAHEVSPCSTLCDVCMQQQHLWQNQLQHLLSIEA